MKLKIRLSIKIIVVLILTANYSDNICSQTRNNYAHDSLFKKNIYHRSLFGFSISPYFVEKAKTQSLTGNYPLTASGKYGLEVGVDYYINTNNNYSIVTGLHGGAGATNYKLFISENDFNPRFGSGNIDDNGKNVGGWGFYVSVPVWMEKRWVIKNNSFWKVMAGVNIRFYPVRYNAYGVEEIYSDGNGNQLKVLEIDALIGNNLRPWLNYNIGGGYSFLLPNNNYLQCNLVGNFSDKKIIDGTYQINVSGKPQSTGTYSANLSYIGLSFSYTATGAKKRVRKMLEEKMKKDSN